MKTKGDPVTQFIIVKVENVPLVTAYGIYDQKAERMYDFHLYDKGEATTRVDEMNLLGHIRAHWPDFDDPEVQDLIKDPEWEPVTDDKRFEEPRQARFYKAAEHIAKKRAGVL